ncbi:MAG: nucleoside deaminase [Endomicrobia bacterium]|nr:nucleoside deaminase [Endomicrobiia bacterium]
MNINKNKLADKTIVIAVKNVKHKKGGPFSAIIVKDGKIISSAYNSVIIKNDPTAHAEMEAIRKAAKKLKSFDLSGCEIFSSCEPCSMCLSAIYWAKIKKIYCCAGKKTAAKYGFKDEIIFKELNKPSNKRKVRQIFIENKNKNLPFKEWKMLPDKKKY